MGTYQGVDYREIPIPEEGEDHTGLPTKQRRAYIWHRIEEEGHPSLLDKNNLAKKLDISRRQVYYDIDAVAEFIEEELMADFFGGRNVSLFEKAKREALQEGEWEAAVQILMKQSEWLEDRGALDKEPDEHEVTWRSFVEDARDERDR